ncbi:flagellar assembly peptidoglycan hydrolase FlgJ [Thalassotalea agariperforans]
MSSPIDQAQNFFDLNGLNNITLQSKSTDQASKDEALTAAAKQFEAIFMQMLLKSMRSAQDVLESDSPFNSQTTKFYRDMHDQQLAVELSSNGSLGLSELIVRQLGGHNENFTPHSVLRADGELTSRTIESSNKFANDNRRLDNETMSLETSKNRQIKTPFQDLINLAKKDQRFEQPQDFVSALIEPAKQAEKSLGVPYQVVIAQAALETGWGKKIIVDKNGESSNNLFNIKADKRWQGDHVTKDTLEFEQGTMVKKSAPFRVYSSVSESVNDYIKFLSNNPRYEAALEKANDVEHFLQGIQKAGYATDPQYAEKILGTLKRVGSLLNR